MKNRRPISEWINDKLREPEGETFKAGKWRFWFLLLIGLSILNAIMTALIFGGDSQGAIVSIVLAVGALIGWVTVGTLYYSDSSDGQMASRVSLLDSITLLFVIAHFCGLLWVLGHLYTIRRAEAKYEARAAMVNEELKKVSTDNVKIAEAVAVAAKEATKAEKLRNDTAYQQRKAAEAGARISGSRVAPAGQSPSLSTSPIELERPEKPKESSLGFLAEWDALIRLANFGELILAAVTLIYIRNRSARFNAQGASGAFFPVATLSHKDYSPKPALYVHSSQKTTPVATGGREKAAEALRDHLRVISSGLPNHHFKVDLRKPEEGGGLWIRLYGSREGKEKMIAKTKQSDKLLAAVNRPDFRERLTRELIACGFPIEGGER